MGELFPTYPFKVTYISAPNSVRIRLYQMEVENTVEFVVRFTSTSLVCQIRKLCAFQAEATGCRRLVLQKRGQIATREDGENLY